MATKYASLIREMYQQHQSILTKFDELHGLYAQDQKKYQEEFNDLGEKVLEVMRFYERQLCGKSERSGMGVYSSKLAEKFWSEIKKRYSMLDFVGAKIS